MKLRVFLLLACGPGLACHSAHKDASDTAKPGETGETADSGGDSTDSALDTGEDTGGETSSYDWSACPGAEAYVGDTSWTGLLTATDTAVYCSAWNEARTLEQELAAKALLKFSPGDWAIPAVAGDYSLALPVCTLLGAVEPGPIVAGAGTTTVTANTYAGETYTTLSGAQPMALDGAAWSLGHTLLLVGEEGAAPAPLTLSGEVADPSGGGLQYTLVPQGTETYDATAITFGECDDASWTTDVHDLSFEGGDITLRLKLGDNVSGTAPGAFVEATGTLDGQSFDQKDYFHLIYRPGHHHYTRDFAVIFDAPIGDVCALRVESVDPHAETPTATVSTAGCDLSVIETRAVTAQSAELGS